MEILPVSFAAILDAANAQELVSEYSAECSIPEIGRIDPQREIYRNLELAGVMQCFAAVHEGEIVGFANVLWSVIPHYGKKIATVESLFVLQRMRQSEAGQRLMGAIERHAREAECGGILYSAPAGGRLEQLLRTGRRYRCTNTVFFRNLP